MLDIAEVDKLGAAHICHVRLLQDAHSKKGRCKVHHLPQEEDGRHRDASVLACTQ